PVLRTARGAHRGRRFLRRARGGTCVPPLPHRTPAAGDREGGRRGRSGGAERPPDGGVVGVRSYTSSHLSPRRWMDMGRRPRRDGSAPLRQVQGFRAPPARSLLPSEIASLTAGGPPLEDLLEIR